MAYGAGDVIDVHKVVGRRDGVGQRCLGMPALHEMIGDIEGRRTRAVVVGGQRAGQFVFELHSSVLAGIETLHDEVQNLGMGDEHLPQIVARDEARRGQLVEYRGGRVRFPAPQREELEIAASALKRQQRHGASGRIAECPHRAVEQVQEGIGA